MNEIICPECGRPNLPEATKCWYCQFVLEKNNGEARGENALIKAKPGVEIQESSNAKANLSQELDIPEWLQRIRERVQTELSTEEEIDQWQQEVLFNGQKGEGKPVQKKQEGRKGKTRRKTKPAKKSPDKPAQDQLLADLVNEPENDIKKEKTEKEPDTDGDNSELPDGFIQFRDEDV